jgi:hypothetical protein
LLLASGSASPRWLICFSSLNNLFLLAGCFVITDHPFSALIISGNRRRSKTRQPYIIHAVHAAAVALAALDPEAWACRVSMYTQRYLIVQAHREGQSFLSLGLVVLDGRLDGVFSEQRTVH